MPTKQGTYYYIRPDGTTDTLEVYDEVLTTTEHIYAIPFGTRVVYTAMVEPDYGTASKYRAPQYNSSKALAVAYRLQIPLIEASWKDIKSVVESGVAKDFWSPGDVTAPFTIKGTIDGVSVDTTARAQIIGIEHNPTYEGINNVHFAIVAESTTKGGNPVMLTALGTHKHHTSATNIGGWRLSDIRPVCEEVFAALPADMRAVISYSPKYTDNKGYRDGNIYADSISYTYNHIWTPTPIEYHNSGSSNTYEKNYQIQYDYMITYTHKNSLGSIWSRTPRVTENSDCYLDLNGSHASVVAAYGSRNVLFCFAVGGYNGDTNIGSTAGPGPGGIAGVKPGGLVIKTGAALNFKLLRSLPFYLKDIATVNNTSGTISADDIFFLEGADIYGQYDNRQTGSGANLQLYFQGLKLTGSATPNVIIIKTAAGGYDESIIKVPFTVTKTDTTLTLNKTAVSFTSQTASQNTTVTLTSNQEDDVTPVITSTAGTITQYKEDSLTDGTLEYKWTYKTSPSTQPSSLYIRNRKKGDVTVTVKYPETDRFLEISKIIAVTNSVYLGDLDALSPADIQKIINEGQAANVWKIGDTIPVSLTGTVGTCDITGNYKIVIIGIDHNPAYEIQNNIHRVHFGIVSSDNKYIAFCDNEYDALSTSVNAYVHYNNNTNPNAWIQNGYHSSLIRARMTQLYNCFPTAWKNVIKTCVKTYGIYGDPNPHAVRDKVFIPSYKEAHTLSNTAYPNVSATQAQYPFYGGGAGNYMALGNQTRTKVKADNTSTKALWHLREVTNNPTTIHIMDNSAIQNKANSANLSSGLVPCFTVADSDAPNPTAVTAPTISGTFTWNTNGTTVYSPTVNGTKLNTYTDWVSVTGDNPYKYKRDFGNYTVYVDEYEGIEPGSHKVKIILNDTINMAWGSTTGVSTNIVQDWIINKISVAKPTIQTGNNTSNSFVLNNNIYEREYSGGNIQPTIQNVPSTSIATRDDDKSILKASTIGTYYIYYSLTDPVHYKWEDTSLSTCSICWKIIRQKIAKPSGTNAEYTYDTTQKSITIINDTTRSPVTRTADPSNAVSNKNLQGTNAGTYKVTYSLGTNKSNYQWSDGTDGDVTIILKINKRSITKPSLKGTTIIYDGSQRSIASATYLNNYDSTYIEYSGKGSSNDKPTDVGDYTLVAKLSKGADNTYWGYNTNDTGDVNISWSIKKKGITKPSLSTKTFYYDQNKTVDIISYLTNRNGNVMNYEGDTEKQTSGNYTLTVTIKNNNYCWGRDNSGDTGNVNLGWEIKQNSGSPYWEFLPQQHVYSSASANITLAFHVPDTKGINGASIKKVTVRHLENSTDYTSTGTTVSPNDGGMNSFACVLVGQNPYKLGMSAYHYLPDNGGLNRSYKVSVEIEMTNSEYAKKATTTMIGNFHRQWSTGQWTVS